MQGDVGGSGEIDGGTYFLVSGLRGVSALSTHGAVVGSLGEGDGRR